MSDGETCIVIVLPRTFSSFGPPRPPSALFIIGPMNSFAASGAAFWIRPVEREHVEHGARDARCRDVEAGDVDGLVREVGLEAVHAVGRDEQRALDERRSTPVTRSVLLPLDAGDRVARVARNIEAVELAPRTTGRRRPAPS